MDKRIRLGELLVGNQVITDEQLKQAISRQQQTGVRLGQALIALGFITEETLIDFLSKQLKIPAIDLKHFSIDTTLAKLLAEPYARRFQAIVLQKTENGLLIGMADPLNLTSLDEIRQVLQQPISPAIVRESDLARTFDQVYRRTEDISHFAEQLSEEVTSDRAFALADLITTSGVSDAPVIKLIQSLFEDAVQVKASDIHIEPDEKILRIRLRVDGVLHEQIIKERTIAPPLTLKLKLMAGLNISEKRLPQDGRFNIRVKNKTLDIRFSTLPTQYGESIVMRLLDQSEGILNLDHIGMDAAYVKRFRKLLKCPYGMILVTGPTGSGKSTTLYGALNELNVAEKKIITVEDPVEYRLPRITQVQVNPHIELTFARVLRTILRQDPNIIMLGEMRDTETAEIAIRSALTGHLVLSTLHTNDSASSAMRLIDMKIDGFLVAATLRGILAQRLVRRICDNCRADYALNDFELEWVRGYTQSTEKNMGFKQGKGCFACNNTGFKGRIGVFELLELNLPMMNALRTSDHVAFSEAASKALKGQLLMDNAFALAKAGITTMSEVIRVAGEF